MELIKFITEALHAIFLRSIVLYIDNWPINKLEYTDY